MNVVSLLNESCRCRLNCLSWFLYVGDRFEFWLSNPNQKVHLLAAKCILAFTNARARASTHTHTLSLSLSLSLWILFNIQSRNTSNNIWWEITDTLCCLQLCISIIWMIVDIHKCQFFRYVIAVCRYLERYLNCEVDRLLSPFHHAPVRTIPPQGR